MNMLFKRASVFENGLMKSQDILVCDGMLVSSDEVSDSFLKNTMIIDSDNFAIFPGFCDVHVHLREPGFSYKETMKSGSLACAHGGYTAVCAMPNLVPTPDCRENLEKSLDIINKDACIRVFPYGTITKGEKGEELSDMEEIAADVIAFSDDGRGVQSDAMMERAMTKAKSLDKIIAAHCEANELLRGGYIHDGEYAKAHGHAGICSESEWKQIERDIELVKKTGVSYHVCHISTKESVELIRQAKKEGVDITCETGPHYLLLDDSDLLEDGRFKMNPPLRSREDRLALIDGIIDGTIDMIATDHAPHSAEEKSRGLKDSMMGVVGIETAFPLLYTYLVKENIVSLEKLIQLMSINPRKRFSIAPGLTYGSPADFTVFDLSKSYKIDPEGFLSMGRATPFAGYEVYGECVMTVCGGKIAYTKL